MKFEDDWMEGELLDMRLAWAVLKAREILTGWKHEDVVDLWQRFWAANHWLAAQESPEWFDALRVMLWEHVNPTLAQQGECPSQWAGGVLPAWGLMRDMFSVVCRYGSDDFIRFQTFFWGQQANEEHESQPENPFQWLTEQYGGSTIIGAALLGEAAQAPRSFASHQGERHAATGNPMQAVLLHSRFESRDRGKKEKELARAPALLGKKGGSKGRKYHPELLNYIVSKIREAPERLHWSNRQLAKWIYETIPDYYDDETLEFEGVEISKRDGWVCVEDRKLRLKEDALKRNYVQKAKESARAYVG